MKKLLIPAVALLALAACNKKNEVAVPEGDLVALKVNAAISNEATRAAGTSWSASDEIGISTTSNTLTQYANIPYKYNGSEFAASDKVIYFQDTEEVTFSAYYPFAETAGTTAGTIEKTIAATDQTGENQPKIDYLFAENAKASKANPTVNFTGESAFNHCMSQVTIAFTEGYDVTLTNNLSNYTLLGVELTGTFNTETGEAVATPNNEVGEPDGLTIQPATPAKTTNGTYTADALILFPQEISEIALEVVVDGQTYAGTLKVPGGELAAGKHYVFPVTVNKTGLAVGNAEINDWTTVNGDQTTATMK